MGFDRKEVKVFGKTPKVLVWTTGECFGTEMGRIGWAKFGGDNQKNFQLS